MNRQIIGVVVFLIIAFTTFIIHPVKHKKTTFVARTDAYITDTIEIKGDGVEQELIAQYLIDSGRADEVNYNPETNKLELIKLADSIVEVEVND